MSEKTPHVYFEVNLSRHLSVEEGQRRLRIMNTEIDRRSAFNSDMVGIYEMPSVELGAFSVHNLKPAGVQTPVTPGYEHQMGGGGFSVLKIPGVNVMENPFPDWLARIIEDGIPEIEFDEINFAYKRRFSTILEARKYDKWLQQELVPWLMSFPNYLPVIGNGQLQTRIMPENFDTAMLEGF